MLHFCKLLQILSGTRWDMLDKLIKHSHCHAAFCSRAALKQMVRNSEIRTRTQGTFGFGVTSPSRSPPTAPGGLGHLEAHLADATLHIKCALRR